MNAPPAAPQPAVQPSANGSSAPYRRKSGRANAASSALPAVTAAASRLTRKTAARNSSRTEPPSALRIAAARRPATERASRSPETLTAAASTSRSAPARRISSTGRTEAVSASDSGIAWTRSSSCRNPASLSKAEASAAAAAGETPGRSRANAFEERDDPPGAAPTWRRRAGSHASPRSSGVTKPSGITPMIRVGSPFNTISLATASGEPPKAVLQSPWLSRATAWPRSSVPGENEGFAAGPSWSSGRNGLPSSGDTPRTSRNPGSSASTHSERAAGSPKVIEAPHRCPTQTKESARSRSRAASRSLRKRPKGVADSPPLRATSSSGAR